MLKVLLPALLGLGGFAYHLVNRRAWRRAAARLGMEFSSGARPWKREIAGPYQDFWVQIRRGPRGFMGVIDGQGRIPLDLRLGGESLATRTAAPDNLTGDAPFDHEARITGSEIEAIAVLGSDTRKLVKAVVVDRGAVVDGGKIRFRSNALAEMADRVPGLVELAQHLEGALSLGEEGRDTVLEIAADERQDADLRIRAIKHLTRSSWADVTIPLLEQLLDSKSQRVRRAAISGLGQSRHRPAVERLEALAEGATSATSAAIASALGRIGDVRSEPLLVRMLDHSSTQVKRPAVRALGRVGTAMAMEPLLDLARGKASRWLR